MNRKYNPWLSLVALLLAAVILVLTCTACTTQASAATENRFTYTREYMTGWDDLCAIVITDTETGQQYLFVDGYNCGGLCKLED